MGISRAEIRRRQQIAVAAKNIFESGRYFSIGVQHTDRCEDDNLGLAYSRELYNLVNAYNRPPLRKLVDWAPFRPENIDEISPLQSLHDITIVRNNIEKVLGYPAKYVKTDYLRQPHLIQALRDLARNLFILIAEIPQLEKRDHITLPPNGKRVQRPPAPEIQPRIMAAKRNFSPPSRSAEMAGRLRARGG